MDLSFKSLCILFKGDPQHIPLVCNNGKKTFRVSKTEAKVRAQSGSIGVTKTSYASIDTAPCRHPSV